MMSLRFVPPVSLLCLAVMTVVECQRSLNVFYTQPSICALKGSTVTMSYTYWFNVFNQPNQVFWSKEEPTDALRSIEPLDLSAEPEYSGRVQYFQDKKQDFTMRLSNVTEEDQRKYYGVVTTISGKCLRGRGGVSLAVTDLEVDMISDTVFEGDEVIVTCKTTCSLTETPTFTWYKQGLGIIFSDSNQLHLVSVSQNDAGSYSCAVMGQTYRSPDVTLKVYYFPKSVSVSISSSGEIVEGSSVTLTCSSNANPPVHSYTWYKGKLSISTGQSYFINRISSVDSGEYQCLGINQYGLKYSNSTILNVFYPPKSISVSVSPFGEIVEGSSVTLTCNSDANPPVHSYTWYKVNESSPVGSGQTYSFNLSSSSSGWFYCVAQNKFGSQRAAAIAVTSNGHNSRVVVLCVAVCVGVGICGIAAFTAGLLCVRRTRQKRTADNHQAGVPRAEDSTYTSLKPMTRSSNDVYSTLSTIHTRPLEDTYTALDPRTISADYDTLTTMRKHH